MGKKIEAVQKMLSEMTLKKLVDLFEETSNVDSAEIYTVRGWLMDAIEQKNPEGFDKWLDSNCDDSELKNYVL